MRITLESSRIEFYEVTDEAQVNGILLDEYVKRGVNDDLSTFVYKDMENLQYIGCYVDGDLAGIFYTMKLSQMEIESHIALLKEYRPYARQIAKEYTDMIFNQGYLRITTYIPDFNRSVVNMCLKIGFKLEGVMRRCCYRDGKLYDKYVMGFLKGY
jgi:RimJ/RimL family protein N-acetyltransferase